MHVFEPVFGFIVPSGDHLRVIPQPFDIENDVASKVCVIDTLFTIYVENYILLATPYCLSLHALFGAF